MLFIPEREKIDCVNPYFPRTSWRHSCQTSFWDQHCVPVCADLPQVWRMGLGEGMVRYVYIRPTVLTTPLFIPMSFRFFSALMSFFFCDAGTCGGALSLGLWWTLRLLSYCASFLLLPCTTCLHLNAEEKAAEEKTVADEALEKEKPKMSEIYVTIFLVCRCIFFSFGLSSSSSKSCSL